MSGSPWCTRWPFMFVGDRHGRATGWAVLHAPVGSGERQELFARHRREGRGLVGMTSYLTFPAVDDPAVDYGAVCAAWGHTFREPERYLPTDRPRSLLALSDFTDPDAVHPGAFTAGRAPLFDFVHVTADEPWKQEVKGWALARRCVTELCRAGRRGLVIGAPASTAAWVRGVTLWPRLPHADFLQVLAGAGALLVTSSLDPSPRVLGEALCLDVPVVVHEKILGGWQYVHPATGRFFFGADDVVDALDEVLTGRTTPRAWWRAHRGPARAGQRLRDLVAAAGGDDGDGLPEGPFGLTYRVKGRAADRG